MNLQQLASSHWQAGKVALLALLPTDAHRRH